MAASIFNEVLSKLPQFDPKDLEGIEIGYPNDEFQIEAELFESGEAIPLPRDDEFDPESQSVNEGEMGAAEGAIRAAGIEILAFYKSYRHINKPPFRGEWGVFYINRGVQHITQMLAIEFPGVSNLREIALKFLWSHEIFHAKFDVGVLGYEGFSKTHLYLPQQFAFRRSKSYQPEEALANESAWRYAKSIDPNKSSSIPARTIGIPGISDFFFDFMKNQPNAYARFDENLFGLKSETAAGIFNGQRSKYARSDDLAPWIGLHPSGSCSRSNIPEHLVVGISYTKLISPARYIPHVKEIRETPKFLSDVPVGHQPFWEKTKSKLIKSSCLPGLDFKYFEPLKVWSARVNDNFRAHFSPISITQGIWEAVSYGNHKKMGHG
ncbi:hypothetical protein G6646_02050 [Polynucleobacter paneuropaeus]|nr:hypothetical protein [Polynucleobacter paneuropaeus]